MARRIRSGLPLPKNVDPATHRFYVGVAEALRSLEERFVTDGEFRRSRTGTGTTTTPSDAIDSLAVTACSIPPVPQGFVATAGIGIVLLDWDNPFRYCSNHGLTRVYRGSTSVFGDAMQIGTSSSTVYVDENVLDDTDYWYWIRWVSGEAVPVVGPPTEAIMVHTATDPGEAIRELSRLIANDPLLADLNSPIDPLIVVERYSRERARVDLLISGLLSERIEDGLESQIAALRSTVASLPQVVTGFSRGPAPNEFVGGTRAAAETARDTQGSSDAAWLASYDGNDSQYIVLRYL